MPELWLALLQKESALLAELRDAHGGFFEESMAAALTGTRHGGAAATVAALLAAAEDFSARPPADDLAVLCIGLTEAAGVD